MVSSISLTSHEILDILKHMTQFGGTLSGEFQISMADSNIPTYGRISVLELLAGAMLGKEKNQISPCVMAGISMHTSRACQ